ncbi:MAG: CvpA family protein [Elusimicrobia bacterium]|nr:CvpA family protein [Elusimicrobiota bacterium]
MSELDIALIGLAVLGTYLGMEIGVVSALFNILGGFVGSWAASRFYFPLLKFFPESPAKAYYLIFIVVAGGLVASGIWLSQRLERYFLGLIDKFLGALLGIVLSFAVSTALLFPLLAAQSPGALALFQRSAFAPFVMRTSQRLFRITPASVWNRLDPLLESEQVYRVRKLVETSGSLPGGKRRNSWIIVQPAE